PSRGRGVVCARGNPEVSTRRSGGGGRGRRGSPGAAGGPAHVLEPRARSGSLPGGHGARHPPSHRGAAFSQRSQLRQHAGGVPEARRRAAERPLALAADGRSRCRLIAGWRGGLTSEPPSGPVATPGQSGRLIIGWSLVRVQPGPPLPHILRIRIALERIRTIGSSSISRFTCRYRLVRWKVFL